MVPTQGARRGLRRWMWAGWCVALVLGLLAAEPWLAPLDRRALNLLQALWPGPTAAEPVPIVFDAQDGTRMVATRSWPQALTPLLRRLDAAGVRAIWLLVPADLSAQDHAALHQAAGGRVLYSDVLTGTVRPEARTLQWQRLAGWPAAAAELGVRVRIVGEAADPVGVPLTVAAGDGPLWPATAALVAGTLAPAGLREDEPGAWIRRTWQAARAGPPSETLRRIVVPRLGGPAEVPPLNGLLLALGPEGTARPLAGKTVVVGWDDPAMRVRLPGHDEAVLSEPEFWARTVASLARDDRVGWLRREVAASGVAVLLLGLAALMAGGPPARALGGAAALAALGVLACAAAYAAAAVFVPPTAFLLGLVLLLLSWGVARQLRSARYFRRQLAALQLQLEPDPAPAGRDRDDPIVVVEDAVAALQAQRLFMLDLLDSLPIGVLAADARGTVQLANRRARAWLVPPGGDELRHQPLPQVLAALRHEAGTPPPDLLTQREAHCKAETHDGRPVWVQSRHIGGRLPWVLVVVDMTHFRAVAQARQEALDFLSHDMRAPLSSIAAIVDTPLPDHQPATVQRTLAQIGRLAGRTLGLANAFLAFVKTDEVDPAGFERVFLPDILESVADEAAPRARAEGCVLEVDSGDEAVWLRGDVSLLVRAVRNLVDNALRHGRGQPVRLQLRPRAEGVDIAVIDSGPGLGAAEATAHAPGAMPRFGLGLRFVRRVAALHGGRFTLANGSPRGAVATLTLPCEPLAAQAGPAPSVPAAALRS